MQIGSPSRAPSLKRHSARRIFKPRFSPRHPSICLEIFVVAFAGLLFTDLPLLSPTFEIASPIRMSSTLVRASTEIDILRLESISAFSLDCRRPTKSKSKWERATSGHFRSPKSSLPQYLAVWPASVSFTYQLIVSVLLLGFANQHFGCAKQPLSVHLSCKVTRQYHTGTCMTRHRLVQVLVSAKGHPCLHR